MNIMFLIFSHNVGGAERLLIDIANHMVDCGHCVHLCVINDDYSTDLLRNYKKEVTIHLLNKPKGSGGFAKYMVRFSQIIRNNNIDILHCQEMNCVIFSIWAKLLSPNMKIFDTVHDTQIYMHYPFWKVICERIFCRKIIAISESVKKEILSRNVPESKIQVIYNGIDTSRFHNDFSKIFCKDHIRLGNVARIMPSKKGQLLLLEAVTELKKTYPGIHCFFAGGVSPKYQIDYQKLQDYIIENDLVNQVTFMGSVDDIPSFLKTIDIFVLPSLYEGFGISLIEAMAMGLPSIASNIDGPAEIIQSSEYGILFETGNVSDLVSQLKMMIEKYSLFDHQKIAAYTISRFSIQQMVSSLLKLYLN